MVTNFAKIRSPRKKSRICILSSREFTRRSFDLYDKPSELIERVYGKLTKISPLCLWAAKLSIAHCACTHAFGSCKVNEILSPCIVCNKQRRLGQANVDP